MAPTAAQIALEMSDRTSFLSAYRLLEVRGIFGRSTPIERYLVQKRMYRGRLLSRITGILWAVGVAIKSRLVKEYVKSIAAE